jgi:heterodisulfide reductase subunit A
MIHSEKAVLVVGAGVSGLRSAFELAEMGFRVFLVDKNHTVGGHVVNWDHLFMSDRSGKEMVDELVSRVMGHEHIQLFTNSTLIDKSGSIGNFDVTIRKEIVKKDNDQDITQEEEIFNIKVGAILLTTGFENYEPEKGEYGYRTVENVITLPDFKKMVESGSGKLTFNNKEIHNIAYIYCVGSRQTDGDNTYCSRYCCTAAIDAAILTSEKFEDINNFHYNRGIRTYGKQEILYHESCENGDVYLQFNEENPVTVSKENGSAIVKVNDILTEGKELELEADLVVLVNGMVPRSCDELQEVLKVPVGMDRFFNEVHPKLRPVETVLEGIYIAGCCQGPKNIAESIKSSLSAASKIGALLWSGQIELEPTQAEIDNAACEWCDMCLEACPFDAIRKVKSDGKYVAEVIVSSCKGCGMCVPVCESNAISLTGYSDEVIESMIDALVEP